MATANTDVSTANEKATTKLLKTVAKLGKDYVIKAQSDPIGIFQAHIGLLICRNCGYANPPEVQDRDIPACIDCGLTHFVGVFVGPNELPQEEEVPSEISTTDVEITESKVASVVNNTKAETDQKIADQLNNLKVNG